MFPGDAAHSPEARAAVDQAVETANAKLSRVEQVKKYTIIPGPWTPDTGEVTPKLSLRRRVIVERYAGVIDEMYLEPERTAKRSFTHKCGSAYGSTAYRTS